MGVYTSSSSRNKLHLLFSLLVLSNTLSFKKCESFKTYSSSVYSPDNSILRDGGRISQRYFYGVDNERLEDKQYGEQRDLGNGEVVETSRGTLYKGDGHSQDQNHQHYLGSSNHNTNNKYSQLTSYNSIGPSLDDAQKLFKDFYENFIQKNSEKSIGKEEPEVESQFDYTKKYHENEITKNIQDAEEEEPHFSEMLLLGREPESDPQRRSSTEMEGGAPPPPPLYTRQLRLIVEEEDELQEPVASVSQRHQHSTSDRTKRKLNGFLGIGIMDKAASVLDEHRDSGVRPSATVTLPPSTNTGFGEARTRLRIHSDDTSGRNHGDVTRGRIHGADTSTRIHEGGTRGRINGDETRGRIHGDDTQGHIRGDDTRGHIHGDDTRGRIHGDDTRGRIRGDSTSRRIHGDDSHGRINGDGIQGHIHSDDTSSRANQEDSVGSPAGIDLSTFFSPSNRRAPPQRRPRPRPKSRLSRIGSNPRRLSIQNANIQELQRLLQVMEANG